ncbi:MAG: hypothetical protein R2795_07850 [Saprospiraceae bacterium]
MSQKASTLAEINQAVNFDEPIGPDHPFFTDFSNVRGDFEEQIVYFNLNVDIENEQLSFNPAINSKNKVIFFLGGMRGSGKTSELQKYAQKLHHAGCFFCVTCNIDDELDLNHLEYMDILVFQLEKLTEALMERDIQIDSGAMKSLRKWFAETVTEVNRSITGEVGIELGAEVAAGGFWSILSIFGSLKAGMKGSRSRATSVRTTLKNRFDDFASQFNIFVEEANAAIRKRGVGQEVLFIVDGLEKTMTADTRRKIILDETNRFRQIEAYTLFTLPIELMKERQILQQYFFVESFPFVKIMEKNGQKRPDSIEKFKEFVFKRIDPRLFEEVDLVEEAICLAGGSPRELLKILKMANVHADRAKGVIDRAALDKAMRRLANQTAQYVEPAWWQKIAEVVENNQRGDNTPFDETVQKLLERILLMEYNDGNYKRPNPILEKSDAYQQFVPRPA